MTRYRRRIGNAYLPLRTALWPAKSIIRWICKDARRRRVSEQETVKSVRSRGLAEPETIEPLNSKETVGKKSGAKSRAQRVRRSANSSSRDADYIKLETSVQVFNTLHDDFVSVELLPPVSLFLVLGAIERALSARS